MAAKNDITVGKKFGRLTVVSLSDRTSKNRKNYFVCRCDCGKTKDIRDDHLKSGRVVSCGCFAAENARVRMTKHGHRPGLVSSRTYVCWCGMISRCKNKNVPNYKKYGGRGITICERWSKFENFLADMGECPQNMSLDRIDNNGNYDPENCRWATVVQQQRNKRNNVFVDYLGSRRLLVEIAKELNLDYKLVIARHKKGWPIDRVLSPIKFNTHGKPIYGE